MFRTGRSWSKRPVRSPAATVSECYSEDDRCKSRPVQPCVVVITRQGPKRCRYPRTRMSPRSPFPCPRVSLSPRPVSPYVSPHPLPYPRRSCSLEPQGVLEIADRLLEPFLQRDLRLVAEDL